MKRFLLALAAALVAFVACDEVEIPANITIPNIESLELFNSGINFSATKEGGTQSVSLSFVCTVDWSVAIEEMTGDWLTVSPTSGTAGAVTITVTAKDNPDTAPRSAKVTVKCSDLSKSVKVTQAGLENKDVPVSELKLDKNSLELEPGQSALLTATVLPDNATDKTVTWSTSNEKVATVKDGKVTAANPGEAVVSAVAGSAKAECKVIVKKPVVEVQSVTLNKTSVQIYAGQSCQLTATVAPDNATNKSVSWQSSNTSIATVDNNGLVQAIGAGTAKITAVAGSAKAECVFEVFAQSYAEPMAVDLGLSVKWASHNLGASVAEEEGYYFAWGETEPRLGDFSRYDYKFYVNGQYTKYCSHASAGTVDNKMQLELEDDAAHIKLGNGWRLPTQAEVDAIEELDWTEAKVNGVCGFRVTAKNGNSVFFPFTGDVLEGYVHTPSNDYSCDSFGGWTSTRASSTTLVNILKIFRYTSNSSSMITVGGTTTYRYSGRPIRPVKD